MLSISFSFMYDKGEREVSNNSSIFKLANRFLEGEYLTMVKENRENLIYFAAIFRLPR